MRKFNVALSLFLFLGLAGCGSQLRQPFCPSNATRFPAEWAGTYELVVPQSSFEWSGNWVLQTIRIEIFKQKLFISEPVPTGPFGGALCEVSGRYFSEKANANGTFSVSEISKFSDGLIISSLSTDLAVARARGVPLHYLPKPESIVRGSSSIDIGGTDSFIVDNSKFSAESLIAADSSHGAILRAISYQVVLRSVHDQKKFRIKATVDLAADRLKH